MTILCNFSALHGSYPCVQRVRNECQDTEYSQIEVVLEDIISIAELCARIHTHNFLEGKIQPGKCTKLGILRWYFRRVPHCNSEWNVICICKQTPMVHYHKHISGYLVMVIRHVFMIISHVFRVISRVSVCLFTYAKWDFTKGPYLRGYSI